MSVEPTAQQSLLMKVPEVAALFQVDPETVRVWARGGKLLARRDPGGRTFVFRRSDVYALFNDPESELTAQNEAGAARCSNT